MKKFRELISIFILIIFSFSQISLTWAGCWKTAQNCNCKIWSEIPDLEFNWDGGTFDNYAHGMGTLKVYRNGQFITEQERGEGNQIFYGAYNNRSIHDLGVDKYVGEVQDGHFEGVGVFIKNNGEKYIGEFSKSKPNGNL